MKILILTGSPRQGGNTQTLVQAFCTGAEAAGHECRIINTAKLKIGPCLACDHCRKEAHLGVCSQQDDMQQIYEAWPEADALVLASPLYYFGFSAQIKCAIDRFYAIPGQLQDNKPAQFALLGVCGDAGTEVFEGMLQNFRLICHYFGARNAGEILVHSTHGKGAIQGNPALAAARELGAKFGSSN